MLFERKQGKKVSKVTAVRWRFYYLLLFAFACEEAVEVKWMLRLAIGKCQACHSHYVCPLVPQLKDESESESG